MLDLLASRIPVIEAIEAAAHETSGVESLALGPRSWDRIDYPFVEVLPESSDYQGGNEYSHTVRINTYFERGRDDSYYDHLETAIHATVNALARLDKEETVVTWRPQTVEDFAGELDNTLILMISVQIRVTTLHDLAE